jgi:hypothetical protein
MLAFSGQYTMEISAPAGWKTEIREAVFAFAELGRQREDF